MFANQRKEKILEILREEGVAKVSDLAKIFGVTDVTIRQDLEKLESEGLISKEYGGAFIKNSGIQAQTFMLPNHENMAAKMTIAEKCIDFIESGDIIILDSGTTTTELAKKMRGFKDVTVITNALNIAILLGAEPGIEVLVTGGEFKTNSLSLSGYRTAEFFKGFHVDKLFFSAAGVSSNRGITYRNMHDLSVKEAMINAADTVYLLADSSKIGTSAFASLGALTLVDFLITDGGIVDDQKQLFHDNQIELIVAN